MSLLGEVAAENVSGFGQTFCAWETTTKEGKGCARGLSEVSLLCMLGMYGKLERSRENGLGRCRTWLRSATSALLKHHKILKNNINNCTPVLCVLNYAQ